MIFINGLRVRVGNEFINGAKKSPINYNPLNLPPYTIRLKYKNGVTPSFTKGTGVQVSQSPNIWDLTFVNSYWGDLLNFHPDLLEVLGANTTGVTSMYETFINCTSLISISLFDTSTVSNMMHMFAGCTSLTTVPLFDTSSVTDMSVMFHTCTSLTTVPLFDTSNVSSMSEMFHSCTSLTTVPLFDTSKVTDIGAMFVRCTSLTTVPLFDTSKVTNMDNMLYNCYKVESGALALYQQASSQAKPPISHYYTFKDCGRDTQTGSAELAQIPDDWK